MPRPSRGEVWVVDLGLAGKVRPCLLLTDWPADTDLALVSVLAHTTALRGSGWELPIQKPFLKEGAFQLQQIQSIPVVKLERKLGELHPLEMANVAEGVKKRLRL